MITPIIARLRCESVTTHVGGMQTAILHAVREQRNLFSNYSRYGEQFAEFKISITRPEAYDSFKAGRLYDFTIGEQPMVTGPNTPAPGDTFNAPPAPAGTPS